MTQIIHARKSGKPVLVELPLHHVFRRPKVYEPIDPTYIVGLDSESFKNCAGQLRTNLVQLDFCNSATSVVLDTTEKDFPIEAVFDALWTTYSTKENRPSDTKQRNKRTRSDGYHRDGRRQYVQPVVLIAHNLEYDLGRLIRYHHQFRRAIQTGNNSVRILIGAYEVEIATLIPTGNAPNFEFFIRKDGFIMRVMGRDTCGYWKMSLEKAVSSLLGEHKEELPHDWFTREWESFSPEEMELLKHYAARDPKLTRELYLETINLLRSISKYAICRNGLIPISASGASAKMAFAQAEPPVTECINKETGEVKEIYEWHRPPAYIMQMGAKSYRGGRILNVIEGFHENVWVRDFISAYGYALTLLPDPATCEYIEIEPCSYQQSDWRGKWGCVCVSGKGLDKYYPALRVHDDKQGGKLQGIYGPFQKVWATIPEIVIGVESGRLEITAIHAGVEIVGSIEHSFLRKFVLQMFHIKQCNQQVPPLYLIAKLLINSLSGKLVEINYSRCDVDDYTAHLPLPDVKGIEQEIPRLMNAYVRGGEEAVARLAGELDMQYVNRGEEDDLPLFVIANKYFQGKPAKAGHYYLPVHASQVSGFTSARLGLAAACMQGINGHTDAVFTIGRQEKGFVEYKRIMEAAGYPEPLGGDLGSFRIEVRNASGYIVQGGLYALLDEYGKVVKVATHGLPSIPVNIPEKATEEEREMLTKEQAYRMVKEIATNGSISYKTKPRPIGLMEAIETDAEPGTFTSHHVTLTNTLDPNLEKDAAGKKHWKTYQQQTHAVASHENEQENCLISERLTPVEKVTWMINTGWSQREVARNVGCIQSTVSRILSGERNGKLLAKHIDRAYTRRLSQVT